MEPGPSARLHCGAVSGGRCIAFDESCCYLVLKVRGNESGRWRRLFVEASLADISLCSRGGLRRPLTNASRSDDRSALERRFPTNASFARRETLVRVGVPWQRQRPVPLPLTVRAIPHVRSSWLRELGRAALTEVTSLGQRWRGEPTLRVETAACSTGRRGPG